MAGSLRSLFFSFSGRIGRGSYLWASAALLLVFFILFVFLDTMVHHDATWLLYPPYFWSAFALAFKRLHDRGSSAWCLLLVVIPVFGPLWLAICLYLRKGSPGENQFGPDPREEGADYLRVDISKTGSAQ